MKYYTAIVAIALLLAAAPVALAANGDGQVLSYKPNVASTGDKVTLQIQLYNDATDSSCLDEIIITPPANWGGTADVTLYDRSAYNESRQRTDDNVNLVADSQSSRIVPYHALCPGETVNIEIANLTAPANYEVSDIVIKTSDQTHNPGSSEVYKTIDTPIPGTGIPGYALPKVYVTKATKLELEYFHIESFTGTGTKGFTARAWGAWARLDNLTVQASAAGPITITADAPNGPVTIFTGSFASGGIKTLTMDYSTWGALNNNADVQYGYLRDQAGTRAFHITYGGTLTLLGSTDKILQDPDYGTSGLTGAQGTIITAGGSEQRKIMVNLVDDNGYDINETIPLNIETDLGSIVEVAPYLTDASGNKYFTLNPGCKYGIADVNISTDPLKTTPYVVEHVGIDSNVPASFAVVEGSGAYIPAGESQLIKVEVYDSCGNLVSNTHQQFVNFTYITPSCGSQSKLAQVLGEGSNNLEQEFTDMGVAEVYLVTDCQICTHNVKIEVPVLPGSPKTIQLFGVNGKPVKMDVTIDTGHNNDPLTDHEMKANECLDATIKVVDACGNLVSQIPSEVGDEMEQWESIVRVTINKSLQVDQPGWASHSQTWISDSDFREEYISNYGDNPYVQGKLNQGAGTVEICGCQGLGTFEVVVESDTLIPGNDSVSVINAEPDCIETDTVDQLLQCEQSAEVMVAIKDVCGNYWRNQGCGSGEANYCVDLELGGTCGEAGAHLSTETVCVPVGFGDPGYLINPVVLYRDTEDCCALQITADKGSGCCLQFPDLEQCDRTEVLFHGAPAYMNTTFFKTRKLCEPVCPPGKFCTDGIDNQGHKVSCWEQLHEELIGGIDPETEQPVPATETVSEEVLDLFTVYDACGHIVKDYDGEVDVEVRGEDCASIYQVDHPLELTGGWCEGMVQCTDLTQFGQAKCQETDKCLWNSATNEGQCSGTPNCSKILDQTTCSNWDCDWDPAVSKCKGLSEYHCQDPGAPPGKKEQLFCTKIDCTWTPTYSCKGDAAEDNCAPYTKAQCLMVGAAQEPRAEGCEWTDSCAFDREIIKKLVIHNCKPETEKQWLPLEKDDMIVDKLAFQVNHEVDPNLWLYIYLESEQTPGFQYQEDMKIGKAPVNWNGPTIIELKDSPTPYWDDQRQGGVLIRAGDSKDFYVKLVNKEPNNGNVSCGTYDAQFLWFQDYNSPDLVNFGSGYPDPDGDGIIEVVQLGGMVEDGYINSDNFNWIDGVGSGTCPSDPPFSGPAPVNLATAGGFVILAETAITTTGTTSIVGDIGISPYPASSITGFGLVMDGSGTFATSSLVTGKVYASDYAPPTPAKMTAAVSDMLAAYTDAAGRANPNVTELGAGDISGMTLVPGLYKWSTGVLINTDVILDCQGNANSAFIFQIAGDLDLGPGADVTLSGSCQANNIVWQVGGPTGATLDTTSHVEGTILSAKQIILKDGASLNGRALAQTQVTLINNSVITSNLTSGGSGCDPFNITTDSRNDDYLSTTPDYGFGDRFLYKLKFSAGQAWLKFRDLVAEDVKVITSNVFQSGVVCSYSGTLPVEPNPENITFKEQPATQIKLLNHDSPPKTSNCEDEGFDTETDAYLFNIQVTDGFDNPVGKELEIELEYCLKEPFGDGMIEKVMRMYCISHGDEDVCDELWYNKDRCYTREDLKNMIEASEYAHGFDNLLFGDFFGKEFADWIDQYFMEAKVEFWDGTTEQALPFDSHGHQVVMTDSEGRAQVYVTAQKAGVYKVIARPLALDGDWAMVSFNGGIPQKLDLMALPSFGVPADGEQEAMLFLRALDECGNLVQASLDNVKVNVTRGTQVYISQDFECKNNYDSDVTGYLGTSGFLGETCLAVLSDLPQTATLMASAPGLYSDTTQITFQGAPVKLAITKIEPSDRLPADGQTGAWVTIQVQDKNGNRVTGYLGNGFSGDPGDPWGFTDYRFETICIDLDDLEASIAPWFLDVDKTTYGWVNFHPIGPSKYCGDLMFGEGKVYVTYGNPDCNHGGTVNVKVWDEVPWQGQEFDENGIPVSVHATQLTPAYGHVDFVDPASQWNLMADKAIALADGKSTVRIEVQVENPFMDVRQAVDGVVYIGGQAEDGAVLSWNGMIDSLNPTSARFVTDPTTGKTYLELTSTTPGKAEITVTGGDAYVCMGLDDITLKGCLAWCGERLPFHADCMSLCLSGDIGTYNCPTCEEYIPKFWCDYSSKQDLTPKTIEVEFLEVASKQIFLDKGWNFISVPYALLNTSDQMSELFNMSNVVQAWKYNGGWVALSGSSALAPLNGYWIKVLTPEVVTLRYATMDMPSIPTRPISAGWNAVGLAWDSPITMRNALMSINNIYSNVIGWIAGLQKYAIPVANTGGSGPFETGGVNMEPKQGYWVWATASGTLAGLAA